MLRCLESAVLTALLASVGCHKEPPRTATTEREAPAVTTAAPTRPEPPSAVAGTAETDCSATIETAAAKSVKVGGRAAVLEGAKLTFSQKDGDGTLVFGVLGPFNEDSPANLLALKKYLAFFESQKADAILVVGDSGETESGIAHILESIAAAKLPVFVVIGNRECRADYTTAVEHVSERFPNLINLNQVRVVEFPEATLVSVPGYHDANFINCAKGCRYFQSTLDQLVQAAKGARSPVILVSHGPPFGEGSQALDYAAAAGNVGDPALRRAIGEASIHFGVFAHIKEAGSRATDLAGTTVIDPDHPSRSLFVNPGPANTAKWKMNDGTSGHGFAAVFILQNGEARWKPLRLPAPPSSGSPKPH